jgi:N-acetylneuraminic acid mutarotase
VGGVGGASAPRFSWTTATPSPIARFEANGVVVAGAVWVMGGFTSSSLEVTRRVDIYDPAADSWRPGPDLPGAETHIAVVTSGGDVIVAGGFSGRFEGGPSATTAAVWRWRAATGAWTAAPALPSAGAGFSWALVGTTLHLAGGLAADGLTDADVHQVWDLAGAPEWTAAAPLPTGRNHGGGASSGNLFYALAGRHGWNEISGDVADVDAFDPAEGTWRACAPIPSARSEIGASTSTLADGRILVVGGSLPYIMPSDEVFLYDPVSDAWSTLPPLPEKRKGAVALPVGDRIVVTTGSPTSTDPTDTTFVGCCL